jgi:hypothetical protein
MNYAPIKANTESMARIPFNWREGLPKKGWRIFSEAPEPIGRRELIVHMPSGRLQYRRAQRHGKEAATAGKQGGERILTPEQLTSALGYANQFWATNPPLGGAHRTRLKQMVTLIVADGDVFKAFSSVDPADILHQFNDLLWSWVGDEPVMRRKTVAPGDIPK